MSLPKIARIYFFIYFGWPSAVNLIEAKQKPTLFYYLPYKYEGKSFLIAVGLKSLDHGLLLAMGLMSFGINDICYWYLDTDYEITDIFMREGLKC